MSRRALAALTALVVALGAAAALPATLPAGASPGDGPPLGDEVAPPQGAAATGPSSFLLELDARSTGRVYADRRPQGRPVAAAAARAQLDVVEDAQAEVVDALPDGAQVLYETHAVLAGVAVLADADSQAELAAIPGVRAVHPITPLEPDNSYAVPLQRAPQAWQAHGNRGAGMRIAIIDTGIDYTHKMFGGTGTTSAYDTERAHADEAVLWAGSEFPNAKVVDGYDLVGDAYNAGSAIPENRTPHEDPNPLDCGGHGSHVAGSAAGYGVTSAGATYAGAYDTTTNFASMRIGPGMAPLAELLAFRVFGCSGSTTMTVAAIDRALDPDGDPGTPDAVDVINMSLGSSFGDAEDASAVAANAAAAQGVSVVASAGNSYDLYDVGGSPGVAPRVLAVAASNDAQAIVSGVPQMTPAQDGRVMSFSSRGTRRTGNVKPDVAAVGGTVFSAASGTGDQGASSNGTSMAAPMVAGLAALVRAEQPAWSPEQVKANIMNTARGNLDTNGTLAAGGDRYGPNRVGAGQIDAEAALDNDVLAYVTDDDGVVSVSFGPVEVTGPLTLSKAVTVQNTGATSRTYNTSYDAITTVPGVQVEVAPATVPVSAGGTATVTVTLRIDDPTALTKTVDATHGLGSLIEFLADASGNLLLTPTSGSLPQLRVPVYAAPRPASVMTQPGSVQIVDGTGSLALTGQDVEQGAGVARVRSLAFGLELQATSGVAPACTELVTTLCTATLAASGADLRYVGVTSNPGGPSGGQVYFGVVTHGTNSTPAGKASIQVYLDTDRDGTANAVLFNTRYNDTERLISALQNLSNDSVIDAGGLDNRRADVDAAVFDSDAVVLPVPLSSLTSYGVNVSSPRVDYGVRTYYGGRLVDQVGFGEDDQPDGSLSANLYQPGLRVTGAGPSGDALARNSATVGPLLFDDAGATLQVIRDVGSYAADAAQGLLMLHFHNKAGSKAQVVAVKGTPTVTLAPSSTTVDRGQGIQLAVSATDPEGLGNPSGPVSVADAATGAVVASGNLTGGAATLTYVPATAGTRQLVATYGGSDSYVAVSSAPATLTVNRVGRSVGLSVGSKTVPRGKPLALTVSVARPAGDPLPTGAVVVRDGGGATVASGTLGPAGTAKLSVTPTKVGSLALRATYAGDANTLAGTSSPVTVTVGKATSVLSLKAPKSAQAGAKVRVTVQVGTVLGAAATGKVVLKNGSKALGSAKLRKGKATITFTARKPGKLKIKATYAGSSTYAKGTSRVVAVSIKAKKKR